MKNTVYEGEFQYFQESDDSSSNNIIINSSYNYISNNNNDNNNNNNNSAKFDIDPFAKQVIAWFWSIVKELDDVSRRKLIQFATGTSRLPPEGFSALSPKFSISSLISSQQSLANHLPIAHTCINKIDIPLYQSKDQMKEKILRAIELQQFGFGIE